MLQIEFLSGGKANLTDLFNGKAVAGTIEVPYTVEGKTVKISSKGVTHVATFDDKGCITGLMSYPPLCKTK